MNVPAEEEMKAAVNYLSARRILSNYRRLDDVNVLIRVAVYKVHGWRNKNERRHRSSLQLSHPGGEGPREKEKKKSF